MKHSGRHTGAFLLLFLTERDNYGGKLLQKCQEELPINPIDSAILYRTLKKLEQEGAIESYLDTTSQDKPIRMYKITAVGKRKLEDFHMDIEEKIKNLSFFIEKYKEWGPQKND
ncbi:MULTISPECIES: PadR family transcriptional regulator [unclassified Bacillus (in: firmicutes)]|uniref:PadR family transcriptional regulator n=1 Tax=unclassified Bacillus (in: firmicutes) TaxID=185979 RepID=UPI0008E8D5A8|nr:MULTISPECIES: helix-turn-helix transcriptional regulator [unclassified Bacillus (in: firmicutes)]SFA85224.1 Transcriptional regulator PadR-like family protein [Bacillus sp. UNCCL13]SFQ83312.1 Transcriptional regulator PadR-like family protein [Bacillus sp. cl95]